MNINNLIITALRALQKNKTRSALSCLGIIIGISSVILMYGLGSSAKIIIKQKIYSYGINAMSVHMSPHQLSLSDIESIKKSVYQVKYITPILFKNRSLAKYRNANMQARLYGVNCDYFNIIERKTISGRIFNESDVLSHEKVAVIGLTNKEKLFRNIDPIGKQIIVDNTLLRVIGVLESAGEGLSGTDFDNNIIMPYTTANTRIFNSNYFSEMYISADSSDAVANVAASVRTFLHRKFNISDKQEDGIMISTSEEKLKTASYISDILQILLSSIASISLIVGGIGIMNIMLASITERTREIGIRMAIGARKKDILMQFLIESSVLTLIGGIAGIVFGLLLYYIIIKVLSWPFIFSYLSILVSVLFSGLVGIFFGLYPSRKAANLKPIEALKYE